MAASRRDRSAQVAEAIKGAKQARAEIRWTKAKEDIPRHDAEFEGEHGKGNQR